MAEIQPIRQKWKGTMTDRDRFNAQMHYRPIDRTFHMEFGYWDENFTEWEMFRKNGIRSNGEADVFFQFDRLCVIGGSWWMEPPFPYQVVEETADTRIIMNGDGLLAEVPRDAHDTIPHFLKATVCTPDDWKRVKAERFRPEGRVIDVEALKKAHPADRDYPLGVDVGSMIGKIRDMLTFEGLCYAMYDYPAMVEDMVETCCVLVEHFLDQVLPWIDFDYASGWEDICFKNGPLVIPDVFRELAGPHYRRISQLAADHGIDIISLDCDGKIDTLVPVWVENGVNTMFPIEVGTWDASIAPWREKYGRTVRGVGGMNKTVFAQDYAAVDREIERLKPLMALGGYIPCPDHRIPPDAIFENVQYYCDKLQSLRL